MQLKLLRGVVLVGGVMGASMSHTAELGHYSPAATRTRDFFVPAAPGAYFALYNLYYTTDTYKDRRGDKVDNVQIGSVNVDVDIDLDSFTTMPAFTYVPGTEILGARYGLFVIQPLSNMALDAQITANIDRGIETNQSSFGFGDTYIQPMWLDWDLTPRNELVLSYGIYLPTGKYEAGNKDNIGLGYFTHQFQTAVAHYFDDHKLTALVGAVTYELNQKKEDVDIHPGDRLTVTAGIDHMQPVSEKTVINVGAFGYGQWQVTEDSGADATRTDVKDQIYAVGLELGLTYLPIGGQASLRWAHEFKAKDRFEGDNLLLTVAIPF